jgi:hypothetical protein
MLTELTSGPESSAPGRGIYPTLALFRHIGAQVDMYQVMSRGRGLTLFLAALQKELTIVFSERITARITPGQASAVAPPLLAAMITSMLITTIRTWIEAGAAPSAEIMDRMFHTAAGPALRAGMCSAQA